MANSVLDSSKEDYDYSSFGTDDIRAVLVDAADFTFVANTHRNLSDIPGAARVGISAATLANKSNTNGVLDADDHTIAGVTGDEFEEVYLYYHSGTESTSTLLIRLDTGTNLPFTPVGGNINLIWDNGANRIVKL